MSGCFPGCMDRCVGQQVAKDEKKLELTVGKGGDSEKYEAPQQPKEVAKPKAKPAKKQEETPAAASAYLSPTYAELTGNAAASNPQEVPKPQEVPTKVPTPKDLAPPAAGPQGSPSTATPSRRASTGAGVPIFEAADTAEGRTEGRTTGASYELLLWTSDDKIKFQGNHPVVALFSPQRGDALVMCSAADMEKPFFWLGDVRDVSVCNSVEQAKLLSGGVGEKYAETDKTAKGLIKIDVQAMSTRSTIVLWVPPGDDSDWAAQALKAKLVKERVVAVERVQVACLAKPLTGEIEAECKAVMQNIMGASKTLKGLCTGVEMDGFHRFPEKKHSLFPVKYKLSADRDNYRQFKLVLNPTSTMPFTPKTVEFGVEKIGELFYRQNSGCVSFGESEDFRAALDLAKPAGLEDFVWAMDILAEGGAAFESFYLVPSKNLASFGRDFSELISHIRRFVSEDQLWAVLDTRPRYLPPTPERQPTGCCGGLFKF